MNCKKYKNLIEKYLDGVIDEVELVELKEHTQRCAGCCAEFQQCNKVQSIIEEGLTTAATAEQARDSILSRLGSEARLATSPAEAEMQSKKRATTVSMWRTIMKSRITRLAAAAVIIIAVFLALNFVGGPDMASVAWGDVANRVTQVDHVHFYEIISRDGTLKVHFEGWYSQGKVRIRKFAGYRWFLDDGNVETVFDEHGTQVRQGPSELTKMKGQTFFDKVTHGLFDYDKEDFLMNVPTYVGEDFLIYRFDPPKKMEEWLEGISVTVGRNSLLPIQFKVNRKDQQDAYDLYIFDYDAPEKPAEFFDAQSITKPPQGKAEIALDGKEVRISISDSPGMEAVTVRLYKKHFENIGELKVLDLAAITMEGFRGSICRQVPWELNKESKFGVGISENWSDKKYRHVAAKIVIRATEKENVYLAEVSCLLDHVEDKKIR